MSLIHSINAKILTLAIFLTKCYIDCVTQGKNEPYGSSPYFPLSEVRFFFCQILANTYEYTEILVQHILDYVILANKKGALGSF